MKDVTDTITNFYELMLYEKTGRKNHSFQKQLSKIKKIMGTDLLVCDFYGP